MAKLTNTGESQHSLSIQKQVSSNKSIRKPQAKTKLPLRKSISSPAWIKHLRSKIHRSHFHHLKKENILNFPPFTHCDPLFEQISPIKALLHLFICLTKAVRYMSQRQGPERQSHREMEVSVISVPAGIYFLPGWPVCHVSSHRFNLFGSFHANWLDSLSLSHSLPYPERQIWGILDQHNTSHAYGCLHFTSCTHTQFTHENSWMHRGTEIGTHTLKPLSSIFGTCLNCILKGWCLGDLTFRKILLSMSRWTADKDKGIMQEGRNRHCYISL